MNVREITNQKILDEFVASQPRSQFTQSWAWGACKEKDEFRVQRFGLYDGAQLMGAATVLTVAMPAKRMYWYIPRGPVFSYNLNQDTLQKAFTDFVTLLSERAHEAGAMFLRTEPAVEKGDIEHFKETEKRLRFVSTATIQPSTTLLLDLSSSEEDLLAAMHQKTRYNIRLAEKKGVTVRIGKKEDIKVFNALNEETTERDQFRSHDAKYYTHLIASLPEDFIRIYVGEYEEKPIAANIIVSFGDMATYVHGASSNQSRNVMAPHLLQWRQIIDAKKAGYGWYDFWGIAPQDADDAHSWAGITRFKRGFGGTDIMYLGAFDVPLKKWWYKLYTTARKRS